MSVNATTKTYYEKAVERMRKPLAPGTTGLDFLLDMPKVKDWVEAQGSLNSKKTYYAVIKSVLNARKLDTDKEAIEFYGKLFTEYFKRTREQALKQEPMEKEENPLTWEEVVKARDQCFKEGSWQDACLLGCYTYIPPRRCDYAGMMVVNRITATKDTNFNYCLLRKKNPVFIFNKFKTEKTFGQQVIPIPPPLANLITQWKAINTTQWLFTLERGDPMDSHRLSQVIIDLMERMTGKKAGPSILRHAFLTDMLKDEKPIASKKPIADMMAHSTHTQELYARK